MRKRTKDVLPTPPEPVEVSPGDRTILIGAYKAGLITAWKREAERGYRLTFASGPDEYVEVAKLTSYLAKLNSS